MSRSKVHELRCQPAYSITEAAAYLHLHPATLRSWLVGTTYGRGSRRRHFEPVIRPAQTQGQIFLSFINLVEAHVLSAIRRTHKIPLQRMRPIIERLKKEAGNDHPLATVKLAAMGKELFLDSPDSPLVSLSHADQTALREVLAAYLCRIECDAHGLPIRLYPFSSTSDYKVENDRRPIVINPQVAYGKPVLRGTAVRAELIVERWQAGESIDQLAEDYGRDRAEVEEALRCLTAA